MSMINDCSNELTKFREDISHQKKHLDDSLAEFNDFSEEIPNSFFDIKEQNDSKIRELIGHIYRVNDLLFSGKNRDKFNEVASEILIQEIIDNNETLIKALPEDVSFEIQNTLKKINFILDQGRDTLDSIQTLLDQ